MGRNEQVSRKLKVFGGLKDTLALGLISLIVILLIVIVTYWIAHGELLDTDDIVTVIMMGSYSMAGIGITLAFYRVLNGSGWQALGAITGAAIGLGGYIRLFAATWTDIDGN